LWENLVLDELRSARPASAIHYWRDKSQREVDFVVEGPEGRVEAIEAKINPDALDPAGIKVFRSLYPEGENWEVCPYVRQPYLIRRGSLVFWVSGVEHLDSDVNHSCVS
jgi:hypothetical protein